MHVYMVIHVLLVYLSQIVTDIRVISLLCQWGKGGTVRQVFLRLIYKFLKKLLCCRQVKNLVDFDFQLEFDKGNKLWK